MDFNTDPLGGADLFGRTDVDAHHVALGLGRGMRDSDGQVMEVMGAQVDFEG